MRQRARVDGNQKELTKELRSAGFSVALTHQLGKGFPDMVVGKYGVNTIWELKDPEKPPSGRKLTPDELNWHSNWLGQVGIALTSKEIIEYYEQFKSNASC